VIKHCAERLAIVKRLSRRLASTLEVNHVLEGFRNEVRTALSQAMEVCALLLDPEAANYTRPLQCALYNQPVNCLSCKRNRAAVVKALHRGKAVVISQVEPIARADGTLVETGPELAAPVFVRDDIVAVLHAVFKPGSRIINKDFLIVKDVSELAGHAILNAKEHWQAAQDKIRLGQTLAHLIPFVPQSVRSMAESGSGESELERRKREVTVLFLDLEGYSSLCSDRSDAEAVCLVERLFSRFVDPIHRSGGEINETAGDGLMIIFQNQGVAENAASAVRAALDIQTAISRMEHPAGFDDQVVFNMGIASGTALVGTSRFVGNLSSHMTYTASGKVTNLAARLSDLAKGGDILISPETRELIDGLWPVRHHGLVAIKGFPDEIDVYSIDYGGLNQPMEPQSSKL
jgi:class 3 adenylate cyclase